MKKNIVFILLLSMIATFAHAQEVYNSSGKPGYHKKTKKKKGYDPDKLIIGGGLNAGFGGGYINAGIAPIVGYRITRKFSAGIGLGYQYNRAPTNYYSPSEPDKVFYSKANIIYPSVWTRHFLYRNIFAEAAFEQNFISISGGLNRYGVWDNAKENIMASCGLVGLGLSQPLGGRVAFYGEIMYDVIQQENSPYYGRPIFRFGIAAGF